MQAQVGSQPSAGWNTKTIKMRMQSDGIVAQEHGSNNLALMITELALCFVGVLALAGGILVWWLSIQPLAISFLANPMLSGGILVAVGLALYAFGTRGFRRRIIIKTNDQSVEFGRINSKESCRITNVFPLKQVDSIYVQKNTKEKGKAHLMLRAGRRVAPHQVLEGQESDIRRLHDQICHILKPGNRHAQIG